MVEPDGVDSTIVKGGEFGDGIAESDRHQVLRRQPRRACPTPPDGVDSTIIKGGGSVQVPTGIWTGIVESIVV